jgi:SAM-dependent methyltransferase
MRLIPPYRRSIDTVYRFLPPVWPGARLLDIGFGDGAFLELAALSGWQTAGVDPDPVVIESARQRGLNVRQGGVEAFSDEAEGFDVITMSHVIEHVHDPELALTEAIRLLRPNGKLFLDTPNIEAAGHVRFRQHWRGLEVPRHLTIFTWNALEDILKRVGFERIVSLKRATVYPALAAASRAISLRENPPQSGSVSVPRRLADALVGAGGGLSKGRREFITLIAIKPG